jgi:hypothetical protein
MLRSFECNCNAPLPYRCSASERSAALERSALPVQVGHSKHEQQCWCCYCHCCCLTVWCAAQGLLADVHTAVEHGCTSMQDLVRTDQSFSSSHRAALTLRMAPLRTSAGHESTSTAFVSGTAIALRCRGTAFCPAQLCKDVPCCSFFFLLLPKHLAQQLYCSRVRQIVIRSLSAGYYYGRSAIAHVVLTKHSSLL